jgi:branched-chain amino acid transport system ATP-binding protein
MGLADRAEGSICVDGEEVAPKPGAALAHGVSLSPEGRRMFPRMSVRENLLIGAHTVRDGAASCAMLDRVYGYFPRLHERRAQMAGSLSGGEQQMAAIGRALMANPDVVLLDEVSLGLSPAAVEGVYASLAQVRADGRMGMIVVEQDLTRALGFADRVICLAEGEAVLEGRPADLTRAAITRAYFGLSGNEAAHV